METADSKKKEVLIKTYGKIILTLENAILSKEKLENSTVSQEDGLSREIELDLRILGCELIQTAGILLKLPQVAMASGQVLFQRFFYSKSFVRHDMEAIAMGCICLASKIEEAPRRIRDVLNVFSHIKQKRAQKPIVPMILDQNYVNLKNQVIKAERRVLKELGFCVHVKHPHKLIVVYLKYLGFDEEENSEVLQKAWNFMNDSFRTDVFVRYQPETIACACIALSARQLDINMTTNPPWYSMFRVSEEDLIDACFRIMELYHRPKPNIDQLQEAVEELKKKYQEQRKKDHGNISSPAAITIVDRSNGSLHNALGGFISRQLPIASTTTGDSDTKHKSEGKATSTNNNNNNEKNSRSRSRSGEKYKRKERGKRTRSRSLSRSDDSDYERRSSKKSSRDKKYSKKSPKRYRDRSRSRDKYSNGRRDRYNDKDYYYSKSSKYDDKYSSSKHSSSRNGDRHRSRR